MTNRTAFSIDSTTDTHSLHGQFAGPQPSTRPGMATPRMCNPSVDESATHKHRPHMVAGDAERTCGYRTGHHRSMRRSPECSVAIAGTHGQTVSEGLPSPWRFQRSPWPRRRSISTGSNCVGADERSKRSDPTTDPRADTPRDRTPRLAVARPDEGQPGLRNGAANLPRWASVALTLTLAACGSSGAGAGVDVPGVCAHQIVAN